MASQKDAIAEFKREARKLYGRKLRDVILYGSWARGDATSDSDIDLAVVLQGPISPSAEIDRMIDIITNINLHYDVLLSVYPVSMNDYAVVQSPLLINLRREGVPA